MKETLREQKQVWWQFEEVMFTSVKYRWQIDESHINHDCWQTIKARN